MSGNELFSLILMSAILIGLGVFVSQPLLRARPENILQDEYVDTPLHHLLSRKDSIYTAMKDLEFDYSTGKLSDEDYEALRDKFERQAAEALKDIDDLGAGVKRRPAKQKKETVKDPVCEACGFKYGPDDKFCQSCGTQLA